MANVLVTGATGFIGGHVVRHLLRRGDHVRCLVRSNSNATSFEETGVEVVRSTFTEAADFQAAVRGVDAVYHLAGQTSASKIAELYRVNRDLTFHLASACAARPTPP